MKKLILIICMTAVVFTLPSCKYISRDGNRSEMQSEDVNTDPALAEDSAQDTARNNSIKEALAASMAQEKDKDMKMLRDSVDSLSVQLYTAQSNIAELKSGVEEMRAEKLSTNSFFVILAIFFVIVIVLVYFLVKKFGLSIKDIEKIASQVGTKGSTGYNYRHGQSISNSGYIQLMNRIASLERNINDINLKVSVMDNSAPAGTINGINNNACGDNNPGSAQRTDSCIFYLNMPSAEREFLDKNRRLVAQEDYLYKFELHREDDKKAAFEFCATKENCVRWALDSQSTMIDRVCEVDIDNRDNGRCKCTDKGEAELRGGKWVVTKKAKVRFY